LKGENKIESLSYLSAVKKEFEKVSTELINLKSFIKKESLESLGLENNLR
jgi:hypothetical protein